MRRRGINDSVCLIGRTESHDGASASRTGRSGAFIYGLSAIDIALWDIAGKVASKPVYQLLGGSEATSLRSYASLTRYAKPHLVEENVARALGSGFRHLKRT